MKRFSTIVLLLSISVMNMNVFCQSLCMTGHDDMADVHASHKPVKHEMPKGDMCPLTDNNDHHGSHHSMPQTSLECDCSVEQVASSGFELAVTEDAVNLQPHFSVVANIQPIEQAFLSNEPIPIEGPPKLVPDRDQGILS